MDFANPDIFWALPLAPVAAAIAAWTWRRRRRATARWASRGLWNRLFPTYSPRRITFSVVTLALGVGLLVLALCQPRWGAARQQVERQGVDVVFVLDTSLSMATRDVQPNRLWVAQTLIRNLVQVLPGHRVALVQAEGDGVVMAPLTSDGAVLDLLLDAVQPGSLPTPGTELKPSLEKALNLFPEEGGKHQVMILLSDGEDHGQGVDAIGKTLDKKGVVVHTVGVGTLEGKPLEMPQFDGPGPVEYKRDEHDQVVVSRLVETNLEALARQTGGLYLRASSAATDLSALIAKIEAMEKRSFGSETVELLEERFQWPLSIAILLLLCHLAVSPYRPEEARS